MGAAFDVHVYTVQAYRAKKTDVQSKASGAGGNGVKEKQDICDNGTPGIRSLFTVRKKHTCFITCMVRSVCRENTHKFSASKIHCVRKKPSHPVFAMTARRAVLTLCAGVFRALFASVARW